MALDPVPWFVGNGAEHSPEVARALAYSSTGGRRGVISPGDLKVTALPTPGNKVRVAPGAGVMPSTFAGVTNQSYIGRNATATDVDVPATSASAATRYLIMRVDDPQYAGAAPVDPASGPYIRLVWVNSVTNLDYPFVALARLAQPANTATITNAMLTNLRVLVNPERLSDTIMGTPTVGLSMTTSVGDFYPDFRPSIAVPEWAGEVSIVATIASIAAIEGNTYGEMAATLGPKGATQFRTANTNYDADLSASFEQRHTLVIGGRGKLNDALKGTTQQLGTEFRRIDGPGKLITRRGTNVIYQVTFYETAV